jgi:phenylalanyl-tRNA synthetase alpha subunit
MIQSDHPSRSSKDAFIIEAEKTPTADAPKLK